MKRSCKACILTVVAFLATGTFAKPLLNVLKISSSAETTLLPNRPSVTTNSFGHVYTAVDSDEELTVENAPSWLKEVKSKQTFRITISANSAGDTNKWFTLNVMTITKNKDNRLGYGYSPTQSIKCLFTRSGAMDGSLKLIYVTPAFGSVRDSSGNVISTGWHINGIACEGQFDVQSAHARRHCRVSRQPAQDAQNQVDARREQRRIPEVQVGVRRRPDGRQVRISDSPLEGWPRTKSSGPPRRSSRRSRCGIGGPSSGRRSSSCRSGRVARTM